VDQVQLVKRIHIVGGGLSGHFFLHRLLKKCTKFKSSHPLEIHWHHHEDFFPPASLAANGLVSLMGGGEEGLSALGDLLTSGMTFFREHYGVHGIPGIAAVPHMLWGSGDVPHRFIKVATQRDNFWFYESKAYLVKMPLLLQHLSSEIKKLALNHGLHFYEHSHRVISAEEITQWQEKEEPYFLATGVYREFVPLQVVEKKGKIVSGEYWLSGPEYSWGKSFASTCYLSPIKTVNVLYHEETKQCSIGSTSYEGQSAGLAASASWQKELHDFVKHFSSLSSSHFFESSFLRPWKEGVALRADKGLWIKGMRHKMSKRLPYVDARELSGLYKNGLLLGPLLSERCAEDFFQKHFSAAEAL
jgi:hypothetical protein